MKLVFDYKKYVKWRIEHERLNPETIDIIESFNNYEQFDGMDFDELWQQGKIILKQWCRKEK